MQIEKNYMIKYSKANSSVQLESQAKTIDEKRRHAKFFRRVCMLRSCSLKNRSKDIPLYHHQNHSLSSYWCTKIVKRKAENIN